MPLSSEADLIKVPSGCSAMGRYTTHCLPQLPSTFVSHAFWMTEPSGGARAKGICSLYAVDFPTSTTSTCVCERERLLCRSGIPNWG